METFVLVHGSWHDGAAWEKTILELAGAGHKAFAPTIAGHGKGANKRVNHADCTNSIVEVFAIIRAMRPVWPRIFV